MENNLTDLTADQLKKIKEKWYKEAEADGQLWKLRLIGIHLGQNQRANYGPKYKFKYEDFELYVDDYGNYLTLRKKEQLICSTHNERLYVKVIADMFIDLWYPKALEVSNTVESDKENKEREQLLSMLLIK